MMLLQGVVPCSLAPNDVMSLRVALARVSMVSRQQNDQQAQYCVCIVCSWWSWRWDNSDSSQESRRGLETAQDS